MKFLKKELIVVLSSLLLCAIGVLGLSVMTPNLSSEQLITSGIIMFIASYFLIKMGSLLIKILLIVLFFGAIVYFFKV